MATSATTIDMDHFTEDLNNAAKSSLGHAALYNPFQIAKKQSEEEFYASLESILELSPGTIMKASQILTKYFGLSFYVVTTFMDLCPSYPHWGATERYDRQIFGLIKFIAKFPSILGEYEPFNIQRYSRDFIRQVIKPCPFERAEDDLLRSSGVMRFFNRLCLIENDSFFGTKMVLHDLCLLPDYTQNEFTFQEIIGSSYLLTQCVSNLDAVFAKIKHKLVVTTGEYELNGPLGRDPHREKYSSLGVFLTGKKVPKGEEYDYRVAQLEYVEDLRKIASILEFANEIVKAGPIHKVLKIWKKFISTHDDLLSMKSILSDFVITIREIFENAEEDLNKVTLKDRLMAFSSFISLESSTLDIDRIWTMSFSDLCNAGSMASTSSQSQSSSQGSSFANKDHSQLSVRISRDLEDLINDFSAPSSHEPNDSFSSHVVSNRGGEPPQKKQKSVRKSNSRQIQTHGPAHSSRSLDLMPELSRKQFRRRSNKFAKRGSTPSGPSLHDRGCSTCVSCNSRHRCHSVSLNSIRESRSLDCINNLRDAYGAVPDDVCLDN